MGDILPGFSVSEIKSKPYCLDVDANSPWGLRNDVCRDSLSVYNSELKHRRKLVYFSKTP